MTYKLPKMTPSNLKKQGFQRKLRETRNMRRIGLGAFASVFGNKSNRVIKVGNGYDQYLRYVRRVGLHSDNIHFPRIHKVTIYQDFYAVVMEKLIPYRKVAAKHRDTALAELGIDRPYDLERPRRIKGASKDAKSLKKNLQSLFRGSGMPDVHEGNVMFRKCGTEYQLVVTDPIA